MGCLSPNDDVRLRINNECKYILFSFLIKVSFKIFIFFLKVLSTESIRKLDHL